MGIIVVYDIIIVKTRKGEKIWKSNKGLHKSPSKRWFRTGIHSLLRWADAKGSADIIYRMQRISPLCRSDIAIDVTK